MGALRTTVDSQKYSNDPTSLLNSHQNRFPLDLLHRFNVILPSVTRNFCYQSLQFGSWSTMPFIRRVTSKKWCTAVHWNIEFNINISCILCLYFFVSSVQIQWAGEGELHTFSAFINNVKRRTKHFAWSVLAAVSIFDNTNTSEKKKCLDAFATWYTAKPAYKNQLFWSLEKRFLYFAVLFSNLGKAGS